MNSKTIIMLLDNSFDGDPRVRKEVDSLIAGGYNIELFCMKSGSLKENEINAGLHIHRIISQTIFDVKRPSYFKEIAGKIAETCPNASFIHCHDHTMLHLGVKVKRKLNSIKLIYDSHELFHSYPLLNDHPWKHPLLYLKSKVVRSIQKRREKQDIQLADAIITVSDSIAESLKKYYSLSKLPLVLKNVPVYQEIRTKNENLREKFNIPEGVFMIHFISGKIHIKGHQLKEVITSYRDRKDIALLITGSGAGRIILQDWVTSEGISNVFFHDPVKPEEMLEHLSGSDFGLLPFWNKKDLSYWYALPNKIFEYIMAGLPVLATVQPEYKKIIEKYQVGVAVNPEESAAYSKGLDALIIHREQYTANLKTAVKELNWGLEEVKLLELYRELNPLGR